MSSAHSRAIAVEPEIGPPLEVSAYRHGGAEPPPLGVLLDDLGISDRWAPMLDWTSNGLATQLPDRTLFRPVHPEGVELPYLDHTIEVVLVDDATRVAEAARVAANAVVRVTVDESGTVVAEETLLLRPTHGPDPAPVLIVIPTDPGDEWLARFSAAVAERPGVELRATMDPLAAAVQTDAPTVVLAERGVLPLAGGIEAAERVFARDQRVGGVAVKLLQLNGSLEAAGAAAFADGSVEPIAAGAPQSAPWHEYVRPVPAAVGLIVLRSAAVRESVSAEGAGQLDLVRISANLWAGGWEVHYQPDFVAARLLPGETGDAGLWPLPPDGLPPRPPELDDGAWRRLLARGEAGAVR